MTIIAGVALAVFAYDNNAHTAQSNSPGSSGTTLDFPIRSDKSAGRKMTKPQPTVSYPIKFDAPKRKTTPPKPTVSYPIDFSTMGGKR
ncbi:hypothetical protein [Streptomyces griseoaurantiacus]|uniref:hypothetical protein n=1 Tax=Streptomyces griseoaurantiacus TaxID=68213 RepID=UPI00345F9B47